MLSQSVGDPSSSSSSSSHPHPHAPTHDIKAVKFTLGKGNRTDAKLVVVHKNHITDDVPLDTSSKGAIRVKDKKRMPEFIESVLLHEDFLGTKPPKVLISVTGAATSYNMDAKLAQIFCKGLVNAAKSTTAWIISGGTDVGIMHYVGEANRISVADVPTIGFATYNMINNNEILKSSRDVVEYDATAPYNAQTNVNLNANHSHFVLIESSANKWGEEIEARSDFEEFICTTAKIPLCLIVVNGGPGTLNTVAQGARRQFPVVIFEGTGRAADAIAREVRIRRNLPYAHLQQMAMNDVQRADMEMIIANEQCITLYNAEQEDPFDLEILKAILTYEHGSLKMKMDLAVEWNRPDLADHLLEAANDNKDNPISPEDFNNVLARGLELALDLERPAVFRLLTSKGARKTEIDLNVLYTQETEEGPKLDVGIERYSAFLPTAGRWTGLATSPATTNISLSRSPTQSRSFLIQRENQTGVLLTDEDQNFVKVIYSSLHPVFHHYVKSLNAKFNQQPSTRKRVERRRTVISVERPEPRQSEPRQSDVSLQEFSPVVNNGTPSKNASVHYTDAMLWAILMGKLELAKVIWEETTLPVHAALLASGMCKSIAGWLLNEQQAFLDAAAWFEEVAVKILDKLSYENAKTLLTYNWGEVRYDALEIGAKTECKDFIGHVHVQRYLDALLYSTKHGGIPPGTNFLRVILCIIMPFILLPSKTYANYVQETKNGAEITRKKTGAWYHFYGVPYTKFWSSTLCYIGYLMLLAVVLVGYQGTSSVTGIEVALWIWMFAYAIEEVSQAQEEGWSYLKYTSNQMDIFIMILQICYVSCAVAATVKNDTDILKASTYLLIVTSIISYVRFLDVFSISKDLGPLYYVMKKIIGDVFKWIFVFILFAIGFQISFMAITEQDHDSHSKWTPTIKGGTFMGAIYIILGDDTTTSDLANSTFGSILVAVYSIIAQIMLVNLLIAMMGDTFNSVKENSDQDWKFFRYYLIVEYTSASFHPPPFNIVVIPIKKLIRFLRPAKHVGYTSVPANVMTEKQREKFKNLMKDMKDELIAEREEEETKTIGAVSTLVRDSFKTALDEQDVKYKSLEKQIGDLGVEIRKMQPSMPSLTASISTNNNNNSVDMSVMQETMSALMKSELGKLHDNILRAVKSEKNAESVTFRMQNRDITITWSESVQRELVSKMLNEYKPFAEWVKNMNKPINIETLKVKSIHVQAVDMFGPRIGFVKFQAKVTNEGGVDVPGIVFMRGPAVAILVILKLNDPKAPDHGKEFTILTIQPRVPAGEALFAEIPAGMLDGGKFAGVAAKELKEETGLDIHEDKLVDLTGLAYGNNHSGMFPSAGGCDEYLRLFLYRATVSRAELDGYRNKLTGVIEEGEKISLKVIPLDDLWTEAPDAKALSAQMLYNQLMHKGLISTGF